jgi:hypothetical protein
VDDGLANELIEAFENRTKFDCCDSLAEDVDLTLLRRPDRPAALDSVPFHDRLSLDAGFPWLDPLCVSPPFPFDEGPLASALLDPAGVHATASGKILLVLCKPCSSALRHGRMPSLALANRIFLGPVPDELKDLTPLEEYDCSLSCRPPPKKKKAKLV